MGIEPSRTRTCDPLVKSQLLYQLSYRPIYMQRAREGRALVARNERHSTERAPDCPKRATKKHKR